MREIALPTFEVGQRVRVWNRPVEWECGCGSEPLFRKILPDVFETVILYTEREAPEGICHHCFKISQDTSGWYEVKAPRGSRNCCVPYTLLELIEED